MKEFVLAVIKSESARFDFYTALAGARAARFDTFAQLVPINNVLSCAWGGTGNAGMQSGAAAETNDTANRI